MMTEAEAIEVLKRAKAQSFNKKTWRYDLNIAWGQGNYSTFGWREMANTLQAIRNQFGPSWLARVVLNPKPKKQHANAAQ